MPRLTPKLDTVRSLALRCRNLCAFPGCTHPVIDENNKLISQLCHIEAAEPRGERYNENQTDEERRAFENLMFLCYPHHQITNDVVKYSVAAMKEMKRVHEALPTSAFKPDKIVEAVAALTQKMEQLGQRVEAMMQQQPAKLSQGYALHTPDGKGPWVPEQGRFYEYFFNDGTKFRVMMDGDIAHIEQTLADGAIAYYEVNEAGDVKNSRFPYPLEEYRLEIPPEMIVSHSSHTVAPGFIETKYVLKWGRAARVVKDAAGRLAEIAVPRHRVNHAMRLITILSL